MKHLIKNPRDFWAGVMFLGLGGLFAGIALTYKLGTAARMGPGFFPFVLGAILAGLGIAILVIGDAAEERGARRSTSSTGGRSSGSSCPSSCSASGSRSSG